MIDGEIPVDGGTAEIESEVRKHNTSNCFQDGVREGRVRETRPQMEVNAAVSIDIPEDLEEEYSEVLDKLDDQLMRAEEPYYDLGRCEGYYFDYIFRSDRESPAILLFADSRMDFSTSKSGMLEVVSPTRLFEDLFVRSYVELRKEFSSEGLRVSPVGVFPASEPLLLHVHRAGRQDRRRVRYARLRERGSVA